jgi:hypothetical protein
MAAKRSPHFHYHNAYHALDVLPKIPIHHLPLKMTIKLLAIAAPRNKEKVLES